MFKPDDFQYAMENTHVLFATEQRIETFGNTRFRFYVITEPMDRANEVRVRNGYVHAERPQIVAPGHYSKLLLEGFGVMAGEVSNHSGRANGHHSHVTALLIIGLVWHGVNEV